MTKTRLLIIGSGPAGYTAGIYAGRALLNPVLAGGLQKGGQLTITTDVENYPGFAETVQGPWLMEQMEAQATRSGCEIVFDQIAEIDLSERPFRAKGQLGNEFLADAAIICTGASAKWLGLESERKLLGFGVSACATCDGNFFKGRKVCVVGGGNTAAEEALYLSQICSEVILIHRRNSLRAEKTLQNRLFAKSNVKVRWNETLKEVLGDEAGKKVEGVLLENVADGKRERVPLDGVFIAIGHSPNTDLFRGQIDLDGEGYVICEPGGAQTSAPGVFAAGDVCDKHYRQAVTAAGMGCMAALDAERFLNGQT